jgi:2'-5' RNA ligase
VAVTIPQDVLTAVAKKMDELRPRWPGARWSDVANQHVTLKFLGWAGAGDVSTIGAACGGVASAHSPARLSLGELGAFPTKKRVRVVWVGLDDPAGLLRSAARDLDAALQPLGFEAEQRAFTPHLTLARLRTPLRMTEEWPAVSFDGHAWMCNEMTLFRSHLSPKGARYEALSAFPFTVAS